MLYMPTIEEITDKTDVDIQNELDYFGKAIYQEFKHKLIQIYIDSRNTNGLGALVIDLDKSTTIDLDISYYKIEDMTAEMIKVIGENKNYKNTSYFIFMSKGAYFVVEDHLK
jgi:selenocysteine-specific translation elongation factor